MSSSSYGKDTSGFRTLKTSLEPATMALGRDQTDIERFFVCSAGPAPTIDHSTWKLNIEGDCARSPRSLALDELRGLPQKDLRAWIECAGNGRRLFEAVGGHPRGEATDTHWTLGAMGMARWRGPSLATVLDLADVDPTAAWIGPTGLDLENEENEPIRMSLPIDKALHPDTIVALEMNGEPLVGAHGAPARLVVPGWVGAYSVKWLGSIVVSDTWLPSWRADEYYQHRLPDGTKLGPATAHPVKSSVGLEWNAELAPGTQEIVGYARSAGTTIESVEWSVDGGAWQPAELVGPNDPWTWAPFRFEWTATPGDHTIRTRAVDSDGATQPESIPHHPNTILWNAITPHPVTVRAS